MRKNGKQVYAELRVHGEWGVECQFWFDGEILYGRRWTLRAEALAEADAKRRGLSAKVGRSCRQPVDCTSQYIG